MKVIIWGAPHAIRTRRPRGGTYHVVSELVAKIFYESCHSCFPLTLFIKSTLRQWKSHSPLEVSIADAHRPIRRTETAIDDLGILAMITTEAHDDEMMSRKARIETALDVTVPGAHLAGKEATATVTATAENAESDLQVLEMKIAEDIDTVAIGIVMTVIAMASAHLGDIEAQGGALHLQDDRLARPSKSSDAVRFLLKEMPSRMN